MLNIKRMAWELELKKRGNALKCKRLLERWQWKSASEVAVHQQRRLASLLRHAYQHVPYYRETLPGSGVIDRSGVVDLERFANIPLLDKNIIKAEYDRLKSDDLPKRSWFVESSGGSTGMPVNIVQDRDFVDWSDAVKMMDDEWSGLIVGNRRAYVWGSVRDTLVGKETLRTQVGRWLRNELWLNSFRMSEERMEQFVHQINDHRPVQIIAFAENLFDLANFIEARGLKAYSPKAIMTSAGVLYPHMRDKIQQVFRAPVFNRYGSREVGDIACECECHNGLHISSFTHFVEILREDGSSAAPGEYGEIVITLLTNYAMPLLRYRIGDLGVMSEETCACGRGMPLLKDVIGRTTDIFINCRGERIDGRMFIRMLMLKPFIRKFQVVQEQYDKVRIRLEPQGEHPDLYQLYAGELGELQRETVAIMGGRCEVDFEFTEQIETTPSGKYRFTISNVHK